MMKLMVFGLFDPSFKIFTEQDYTERWKKTPYKELFKDITEQRYQKKMLMNKHWPEWLAGKTRTTSSIIFRRITGHIPDLKDYWQLYLVDRASNIDLDEIKSVEDFFNGVIKNTAYWSNGGKLLVNKVRAELQGTDFTVNPGNKEQRRIRQITNVGLEEQRDALVGTLISFKLTATATPIIDLVDRALKRANKTTSPVKQSDGGYYKIMAKFTKGWL